MTPDKKFEKLLKLRDKIYKDYYTLIEQIAENFSDDWERSHGYLWGETKAKINFGEFLKDHTEHYLANQRFRDIIMFVSENYEDEDDDEMIAFYIDLIDDLRESNIRNSLLVIENVLYDL